MEFWQKLALVWHTFVITLSLVAFVLFINKHLQQFNYQVEDSHKRIEQNDEILSFIRSLDINYEEENIDYTPQTFGENN